MRRNLILVIQGPINSIDRGNNLKFNCNINLQNIINVNYNKFNKIIISTWNNQIIPEFLYKKKIYIIKNKLIDFKTDKDENGNNHDFGSRQIETLYSTLSYIDNNSFVVKSRTDLYINFNLVLKEAKKFDFYENFYFLGAKQEWLDDVIFCAFGQNYKKFVKHLKTVQYDKKNIHEKFYVAFKRSINLKNNKIYNLKKLILFPKSITDHIKIRDRYFGTTIKLYGNYFNFPKFLQENKFFYKFYLLTLKYNEIVKKKFFKN